MAEKRVPLGGVYDPQTATFWGRFATAMGQQERHCSTSSLYETTKGELFYVSETRKVKEGGHTESIPGTNAHVFSTSDEAAQWLDQTLRPLRQWLKEET